MKYVRMPIEIESPEQMGYANIKYNLTESSFSDQTLGWLNLDFDRLKNFLVCYGDHLGKPELRALIAKDAGLKAEQVLLTPGAAGALFMISTSLLNSGDHLIVERPNYATNIETPRAIGAQIEFVELQFENGFLPSAQDLLSRINPRTKLVSITLPHNPTGTQMDREAFIQLVKAVTDKGVYLLVDETYREMAFENKLPIAASLSNKAISVCSLSKSYGLPGIRLGWVMTQDAGLFEKLLAAKEQMVICGSVVDEEIGYQAVLQKDRLLGGVQKEILAKKKILLEWYGAQEEFEWVKPLAGVVAFPRLKASAQVDVEKFYQILNTKYQTFVGPGHWFEMDRSYMRVGWGWPTESDLLQGLKNLSAAAREARK